MANIVFLGNFEVPYSSENHHAKSLESLGHTVEKLQEKKAGSTEILNAALKADLFIWVHTHRWQTPGSRSMTDVLKELKAAGVYDKECYVHQDYDPHNFEHDIIFVGSRGYHPEHKYRPQLIDFLRKTYGKRFLHVGGDGDTGTVRGDALNRIYAKSKVAIGDSLNINFNYPYYTSDRLFESTGRGGFTIYPRIKGLEDYFEDGNEIVFYEHGNLEDLKIKIDKHLLDGLSRENIRLAGHERTKKEHTYVHRWASIMNELGIK